MQRVIILRGTFASGKSTLAKSYRDFTLRCAWLKVDNFKDFFGEDSSIALEYVNGSAIATLRYLLEQKFSVVLEGVFQDISPIHKAVEIANDLGVPVRVFELVISLEASKQRDLMREGVPEGKRPALDTEVINRVFHVLKANPFPDAIQLNTEQNNLEECRKIIDKSFEEIT